MTTATDQSTARQWAEGHSPLFEVREIPMRSEREKHVRHYREFELIDDVIEVQGPDGVTRIPAPSDWDIHDTTTVRRIVEALGGTTVAPETDAIFAFGPKVHADEVTETPFDTPAQSLCERLALIPGTRAHSFRETPTGLTGRLTDYGSGRTMDVRIDEAQPDLRPVRSE